jgi:hypothetical protein
MLMTHSSRLDDRRVYHSLPPRKSRLTADQIALRGNPRGRLGRIVRRSKFRSVLVPAYLLAPSFHRSFALPLPFRNLFFLFGGALVPGKSTHRVVV